MFFSCLNTKNEYNKLRGDSVEITKKEYFELRLQALSNEKSMCKKGAFGYVLKYNDKLVMKILEGAVSKNVLLNNDALINNFINVYNRKIEAPNLVLPIELVRVENIVIGYLMRFIDGYNLEEQYRDNKTSYYHHLIDYLIRIDFIMKNQVISNDIFYGDLKMSNIMLADDLYLIDFDDSLSTSNKSFLIYEYNLAVITKLINCFYRGDKDYEVSKKNHQLALLNCRVSKKIKEALNDSNRLDDYWKENYITDNMDEIYEFIKVYKKIL